MVFYVTVSRVEADQGELADDVKGFQAYNSLTQKISKLFQSKEGGSIRAAASTFFGDVENIGPSFQRQLVSVVEDVDGRGRRSITGWFTSNEEVD